jgi:hypothetical protein
MENIKNFTPAIEAPQKMTKARLHKALEESGMRCTVEESGEATKITVELPEEHIQEYHKLIKGAVLNDAHHTKFDREHFNPLVGKIKRSTNLDCSIEKTDKQYVILITKR